MVKRRIEAVLLAGALAFGTAACGSAGAAEDPKTTAPEESADTGEEEASDRTDSEVETLSAAAAGDVSSGTMLTVNGDSGELSVERYRAENTGEMGEEGLWTIFVYLCGTDLETLHGSATLDLSEMFNVESDQVRFVIETGGTEAWQNEVIDSEKIQRLVSYNGDADIVDEQPLTSMGDGETLEEFLEWGLTNYPSEHVGLVLWNHGGGSIAGVCFDERFGEDSLEISEIDTALLNATKNVGRRLDFLGFDACLMSTVEVANMAVPYADYLIASQESEPGCGWNFIEFGDYIAEHPGASTTDLGEVICDSFYQGCVDIEDSDGSTLSVIDLSKIDAFLESFNAFAKEIYEAGEDSAQLAGIVRGIFSADNYGGNNKTEGYTNMVDLGGILDAGAPYSENAAAAKEALSDAVVYSIEGPLHKGSSGLSIYYPLSISGSTEYGTFEQLCVSPYYLAFVDRQTQGGMESGDSAVYNIDHWFSGNGEWSSVEQATDDYWDYVDDYEQTGESSYITFDVEPQLDEEGTYWFALDESGIENASNVTAMVFQLYEDDLLELGETWDVLGDWQEGVFTDDFDGYWLSLPDGQNLAVYYVEVTEDCVIYTSPVRLNGEETNLRLKQYLTEDGYGSVEIEGAWDGISESGASARNLVKLQEGDVIVPLYNATNLNTDEEYQYEGTEYTVEADTEVSYDLMDIGDYMYSFCISDIYGDYYLSDPVMFSIDEEGNMTYSSLE